MNNLQAAMIAADHYWRIRDTGRVDADRTAAHDTLMSKLVLADISFVDREHAAQIGKGLVALAEALESLEELGVNLSASVMED